MIYRDGDKLRDDAALVGMGGNCRQRQDSLIDQLKDLRILANKFGLYDAADFLRYQGEPLRKAA